MFSGWDKGQLEELYAQEQVQGSSPENLDYEYYTSAAATTSSILMACVVVGALTLLFC